MGAAHSPAVIANEFVKQYYSILVNDRAKLHRFYCDASYTMHGEGTQDAELIAGVRGIKRLIDSGPPITKVDYKNVDVQMSADSGVVLLVTGSVLLSSGSWRDFVRNFFLSPENKSKANYFVINDTFRILAPRSETETQVAKQAPVEVQAQPEEVAVPPAAKPSAVATEAQAAEANPQAKAPGASENSTDAAVAQTRETGKDLTWAQVTKKSNHISASSAPKQTRSTTSHLEEDRAAVPPNSGKNPPEEKDTNAIFVKGLVGDVKEDDLLELFAQFGEILHVNFRENRGFAFVEFKEPQAASKSLEKSGELHLNNNPLSLEPRHPKPANTAGGKSKSRSRGKGGRGDGADKSGRGKSGRGSRSRRAPSGSS